MFWAAGQVYGLEFVKLADVPVYHPDMTVYEVRRDANRLGLWYFDPYARAGKSSGAWRERTIGDELEGRSFRPGGQDRHSRHATA